MDEAPDAIVQARRRRSSRTELITADLFAAGDGLLTVDSDTGFEWLDLTETQGETWNGIEASFYVTTLGFRHAQQAEVRSLFMNAGFLSVNNVSDPANDPAATLMLSMMGCTAGCDGANATGRGFAEYDGNFVTRPNYHHANNGAGAISFSMLTTNRDLVDSSSGHFLVRADSDEDGHPDTLDNCAHHPQPEPVRRRRRWLRERLRSGLRQRRGRLTARSRALQSGLQPAQRRRGLR